MNPVINQRCIMILCIGCTDADILTLWCMFQAAVVYQDTTACKGSEEAKLQLLLHTLTCC